MKRGTSLLTLLILLSTTIPLFSESVEDCLQSKKNFWRQAKRDCNRPDARLFMGEDQSIRKIIAEAIKKELTGHDVAAVFLSKGSFAMEKETVDILGDCNGKLGAYKHEVDFTALTTDTLEKGTGLMGRAVVYKNADNTISCIETQTMQIATLTTVGEK